MNYSNKHYIIDWVKRHMDFDVCSMNVPNYLIKVGDTPYSTEKINGVYVTSFPNLHTIYVFKSRSGHYNGSIYINKVLQWLHQNKL
jgi:hypothetical protein